MKPLEQQLASLSPAQRRLMELWLRQEQAEAITAPQPGMIPRRPATDAAPLSFAQQQLWFLDRLEPGNPAYNFRIAVRLSGRLDLATLERSIGEIVRRHEVLRTMFAEVKGQPIQVIAPSLTIPLPLVDLGGLSAGENDLHIHQLALAEAEQLFDLERGPLLRARMLHLSAEEHVLLLMLHHIVADNWSQGVLLRELAALYSAFLEGKPSPLPELPIQYADYAVWQRERLQGQALEEQLAYWKRQLEHAPHVLELPTDRPHPPKMTHRGAMYHFRLAAPLVEKLSGLCRREGVTLFMTLLAAFSVLLHRYTGQTDLVVGSPIAGRNRHEIEGLIGCFINMLVLRTNLAGNPPFTTLVQHVRDVTLGAYAHQDLPFEKLVEALQPARDLSRHPLFQVVFVLQNTPLPSLKRPGLSITPLELNSSTSRFDLAVFLREAGQALEGRIEYSTDLFEAASIDRLVQHFETLLQGIVAQPERRLAELPLLTSAEQCQLLVTWNATRSEYPHDLSVHQLFEAQVERTPDAVALVYAGPPNDERRTTNDERRTTNDERQPAHPFTRSPVHPFTRSPAHPFDSHCLTYHELNRRANQLAYYLRALGVQPETPVGICLERSLGLLVALLGILKAGGVYVPLDAAYPAERLSFMLSDTQARVVITQAALVPRIPETSARIINLDLEQAALDTQPALNPPSRTTADNLAYCMYTSGSTGQPKGIAIPHRGIVRLVRNNTYASFGADDIFMLFAPVTFDASTFEIWGALLNGARLVVPPATAASLELLESLLAEHQVTTLWLTAGLFHQIVEHNPASLRSVRQLLAGGDVLSAAHVKQVLASGDSRHLINGYGPTENTTFTCCYVMTDACQVGDTVAIGRPIANTQVYLLDSRLRPVPIGVAGELYAGGDGLARGYLGRPDLTAERFIPNPFIDCRLQIADCRLGDDDPAIYNLQSTIYNSSRLYRTGDLARYLPDGTLDFLGRVDGQVKIRGFRIELGEVEAALRVHAGVREAVVLAREDSHGLRRLVAYVVPANDHRPTTTDQRSRDKETRRQGDKGREQSTIYNLQSAIPETLSSIFNPLSSDLRAFLQTRLPDYMVPATFVFLEALPLTANGKVDRRALPTPTADRAGLEPVYEAPRRPVEELLATIWAEVLGIARVGVHDNFFALGGDSILSIQIISKANRAGLRLTPEHLFQHQTIAELATAAGAWRSMQAEQAPITGQLPLTPVQRWFFEHNFADPHHWNQALLLQSRQPLSPTLLEAAIHHILSYHDALRLRFNRQGVLPQQLNAAMDRDVPFVMIDISSLPAEAQDQAMAQIATELHASLNLTEGPLLRVALIEFGPTQASRLLILIHHLAIDGISWRILLEDLQTIYQQLQAGRDVQLPPKTTSFKHWAERLAEYARSATLQSARDYWLGPLPAEAIRLPVDYPGGKNTVASARSVSVRLSAEETRVLLQELPAAYNTEINDALLMALVRAFANWTGTPALLVDLEGHGREALFEDVDLSRTVGWCTSIFPVLLTAEQANPGRALKAIKEQLRRVPQRGIGYGLLRYLSEEPAVTTALRARPQAEVSFNYLGQFDSVLHQSDVFQPAGEPSGPARSPRGERGHLLDINGLVIDGQLRFDWTYSANLHRQATVERLAEGFGAALRTLLAERRNGTQASYTPEDFPLAHLDQQKLDKVLTKLKGKKSR